jgi:hypothetical protein
LLVLDTPNSDAFLRKLRQQQPAVIARTENGKVAFDPRTVLPEQEDGLISGLQKVLVESKL